MADLDEPIILAPYAPAWAALGQELAQQVSSVLRGMPVAVEHIGSTSVPGLDAKPVIDIQVGCQPVDASTAVERVKELGFEHLGESGVPGREYLRRRSGQPTNVHVVEKDGRLWNDSILFRDYLRTHPDAAARYARVKHSAAREASMLLAYSELKASALTEIMNAARNGGHPR
ncbi:GrpB family protein [Streptomyces sp. NPDC001691]|uniref:GrpB family protein n=1 Tax=Streptomyces sp. NPDC001691 TaxID=3364600 RepID=UPI0036CD7FAE